MVKAGDVSKVKGLLLYTPMILDEAAETPKEELHEWETGWGNHPDVTTSMFKMQATDFLKQKDDDQLYPGKASDDILRQYPPTFVWTQEFDVFRRCSEKAAARLKNVGRLIDISIMPGCQHGCMGLPLDSQELKWEFEESKLVFDALVRK